MNLHLHSVLLMALDVVKGPYLKCFAPTNPFDSTLEGGVSQPINAEFRNDSEGDNVSGTHCQPGGGKKLGFGFNAPPAVDRINTFSEVFVPRSEFCRRVMYLLEAESGLLYLFYPEEICGQRYQRKTLRYTLCFVFCVDETLASMSTTLTEQILRPYSMVLTRIMEELREAELLYGYVSRGLPRSVEKAPKVQTTISHENSRVEGAAQCMGCDSADCGGGCLSASLPNARVSVSSGSPNEEVLHKAAKGGFCLNVFLTPSLGSSTQEFVPLEELTESVYACLRDDEVGCGERGWSLAPVRERTVSIKLSSTLSFHAGRRAPPCVPQHYELDEVPVPIAEYVEEALESADLTICGVFKEVDGEKTINQIIHALASGHGSQDALLQRWAVPSALLSSQRGSSSGKTRSAFVVGSHSSGNVLEHNTACVPSSGRFSSPHARSTSGVFCHSSCTLESRITSPTASAARPIAHFSVANDGSSNQTIQKHHSEWTGSRVAGNNEHNKQQPLWWEDLQFAVLEALRHLEALNYVRVIKTCKMHCRYRVRNGLYRVMSDGNHSARRSLGERMCLVVKRLCRTDERAENGLQQQCLYGVGSSVAKPASVVATLTLPPALCDRAASYKGGVWEQHDKNRRNAPSHCSPSQFSLPSESVLSPSLVGWVSSGGNSYEKAGFCALQNNQEAVCPKGEIDLTAAAALCALGKFIGCSVSRVQKEMRRHPVWATALAGWKEACCKALVEVALINKWLEEVPYLTEPVVG